MVGRDRQTPPAGIFIYRPNFANKLVGGFDARVLAGLKGIADAGGYFGCCGGGYVWVIHLFISSAGFTPPAGVGVVSGWLWQENGACDSLRHRQCGGKLGAHR